MPISNHDLGLIKRDRKLRKLEIHTKSNGIPSEQRSNELIDFLWKCVDHADEVGDFDISIEMYKRIQRIDSDTLTEKRRKDKNDNRKM